MTFPHPLFGRTANTLVALTLLGTLGVPRSALAQTDEERARQLFDEGVAQLDRGDNPRAESSFRQSLTFFPRATTACNMALAIERQGRACDAREAYGRCVELDRSGRYRSHAQDQIQALAADCTRESRTAPQPASPASPASGGPPGAVSSSGVPSSSVPPSSVPPSQAPETTESPSRPAAVSASGQPVRIWDQTQPVDSEGPDHTLLGVALAVLAVSGGALAGAIASAEEGHATVAQVQAPPNSTVIAGSADAQALYDAATWSNVAIGLYAGAGTLLGIAAVMIIIDLAQPGVFWNLRSGTTQGPQLALRRGRLAIEF